MCMKERDSKNVNGKTKSRTMVIKAQKLPKLIDCGKNVANMYDGNY